MKTFNTYYKEELYKSLQESNGVDLLDKAFMLPLTGYTLIKSEPYAGSTALCIEIAEQQTRKGRKVIYYDPSDSIYMHRLVGVTLENFTHIRPTEGISILDMVRNQEVEAGAIHILDSVCLLRDIYDLDKYTEAFAKQIKRIDPSATIICSQSAKRKYGSLWGNVIDVALLQKRYDKGKPIGHMARVTGPQGSSEMYIEYMGGRISKGFLLATKEIESGTSRSAVFQSDDVKVQGFWKFVDEYDKLINGR